MTNDSLLTTFLGDFTDISRVLLARLCQAGKFRSRLSSDGSCNTTELHKTQLPAPDNIFSSSNISTSNTLSQDKGPPLELLTGADGEPERLLRYAQAEDEQGGSLPLHDRTACPGHRFHKRQDFFPPRKPVPAGCRGCHLLAAGGGSVHSRGTMLTARLSQPPSPCWQQRAPTSPPSSNPAQALQHSS